MPITSFAAAQRVRNGRAGHQSTQGQAVGDALGHSHHVGFNAIVLNAPEAPGAAKAGLNFIGDEHATVLAHYVRHDGKVLDGRRDEPADALDGFGQHRRNPSAGGGVDEFLKVVGASQAALGVGQLKRAAVTVGGGGVTNSRRKVRVAAPARMAGQALGQQGASGVSVAQRDHFAVARMALRHHHRRLVSLAAGTGKEALLQCARGDAGEAFGKLRHGQGGIQGGDMGQALDLSYDGRIDFLVGVADGHGQDAAEEVQEAVAVDVLDPAALALDHHHGVGMNALYLREYVGLVLVEHPVLGVLAIRSGQRIASGLDSTHGAVTAW